MRLSKETVELALAPILESYLNIDFPSEENISPLNGIETKQLIKNLGFIKIVIYSNDHNPPHFHVISKDNSINAKFTIDSCTLIGGDIAPKYIKCVENFHKDPKTVLFMKSIWNKRA